MQGEGLFGEKERKFQTRFNQLSIKLFKNNPGSNDDWINGAWIKSRDNSVMNIFLLIIPQTKVLKVLFRTTMPNLGSLEITSTDSLKFPLNMYLILLLKNIFLNLLSERRGRGGL